MTRIALAVEYDGSAFHGWQTQQPGVRTVQEEVEKGLSRVADHPVTLICAGRTDAGVHATGQVCHFDSDADRDMKAWVMGGNRFIPDDVAIRWAVPVDDDFHARFSAHRRCYRYVIYNHPRPPALFRRQVTWNHRPLDVDAMARASQHLVGTHDFTSYRSVHCQAKSPVKTLTRFQIHRRGPLIVLEVEANAFLMHMVRNMAGVLMSIGAGHRDPDWARQVLEARDRTQGGVTAPPYGLYLVEIGYPEAFPLPDHPRGPLWLADLDGGHN
ncbi:tRNA pseudouridine(38-40) synthase TruA [Alloalcanivorax profundimaris]|uniref:tRNA pseudouridine synthase A n=1 Tax=Alloalcanivorax profundimaris TaxID=2735259 RepID=A0ABS0AW85_9GAMM|nr:tRNA pseudouridine(38-40) synthase TruA [Alloalcanivorax profundimaris]MBM1145005.1 tRNA pseudouridine(38-40) synthase TruA [Alcanivorax sp. ZXX171]MBU58898.1 tRNA pseudouridine(38-40) synthase TruA [Alcanivorax sp.]MCQ6261577.1 tRNA pseudouridine(38-40) synthase TruA [Alcanivorax sp. MM125-6]UWN52082.1 tRNA pseudouridine synthase A [Alcanivorax sp. ALC70]MBF1801537.1 tRNA pseudouridine(38-40) synthase TruA [Alloalcanivorax profundimaris]